VPSPPHAALRRPVDHSPSDGPPPLPHLSYVHHREGGIELGDVVRVGREHRRIQVTRENGHMAVDETVPTCDFISSRASRTAAQSGAFSANSVKYAETEPACPDSTARCALATTSSGTLMVTRLFVILCAYFSVRESPGPIPTAGSDAGCSVRRHHSPLRPGGVPPAPRRRAWCVDAPDVRSAPPGHGCH